MSLNLIALIAGIIVFILIYFIASRKKTAPQTNTGTQAAAGGTQPGQQPVQQQPAAPAHGAAAHAPAHTAPQIKKSNWFGRTILVIVLMGLGYLFWTKIFSPWWKNVTREEYYVYVDNWVLDPVNTREAYFYPEYKEVLFFSSSYPLRISFKNSTTSYCAMNTKTGVYSCGEKWEDVLLPTQTGESISLKFKTRDGQPEGKILILVEKNVKKKVLRYR